MKRIATPETVIEPGSCKGMHKVRVRRVDVELGSVEEQDCLVVDESVLRLEVVDVANYVLAWSPTEDQDTVFGFNATSGVLADTQAPEILSLCIGFLLTEGLIQDLREVNAIVAGPATPGLVRVWLCGSRAAHAPSTAPLAGGCKGASSGMGVGTQRVSDTLRLWAADLIQHFSMMESHQRKFRRARGAHAAAVFSNCGDVIAIAEDIGRHNALDKVIGRCVLLGHPTAGCGVLVSGRINLQMIAKAARAGAEIVAGASAPSSLAIEAAEHFGMTLCGFVRNGLISTFTHPQRLIRRHS